MATRPRFTRLRRKHAVTYKNLTAEDVRVLDKFETQTVKGKAGGFYLPNLIANGSFEVPADAGAGEIVQGWKITPGAPDPFAITRSSTSDDGAAAMQFSARAHTITGSVTIASLLICTKPFEVGVGDVLGLAARVSAANTIASPLSASIIARLRVTYADATLHAVDQTLAAATTSGYADASAAYTVPSASSGAPVVWATLTLIGQIANSDTASHAVTAASAVYLIDSLGLAVTTAAQPYGRIPGSAPLGMPVRFTKTPDIHDAGWAGGCKRYSAMFEVTEI